MTLLIDGGFVAAASARGGGLGCEAPMAPVISDPAPPQYVDLTPGAHLLRIETETGDEKYHHGAYYQFEFSFQ